LWLLRQGKEDGKTGHPPHLVDALLKAGMPVPNGARWVEYAVPSELLVHEIRPQVTPVVPRQDEVDVIEIRYRLNRRIPIPLRYMVAVARAFRNTAVDAYRQLTNGGTSLMLSGRELDGAVARGHRHAYYLPCLREGTVTLDELIVRVPGGHLTRLEYEALLGVERIPVFPARADHNRAGAPGYPITVVPETVVQQANPATPARRWRSTTPFLPPLRHRRGRERTCIERQAISCAEAVCGRLPVRVERILGPGGLGYVSPILAHEYGTGGGCPTFSRRLGYWLELVFDEPVVLDRPLGADTHFGAGQFEPQLDRLVEA